jgi:DNA-binding PucR family transcriptional regulator
MEMYFSMKILNSTIYCAYTNPNIDLLNFCSDGLLKLIDYDKKNNTEYFKTLKAYIAADKNAVQTAKNMYIHRNTINYRLNKIKEIANLDLENGDEIFRLTMSMKILEFNEHH